MEPSTALFDSILGPTALYCDLRQWDEDKPPLELNWETSCLNPKNRIESLAPLNCSQWRQDGVDVDGTRFFMVPTFSIGKAPLRVDVYIPGQAETPLLLRQTLQSGAAMTLRSRQAINLPLSHHVLRAIERWSAKDPDFQSQYASLPFGSKIVIDNLHADLAQMDIHLVRTYDVEQSLHSLTSLQSMWSLTQSLYPPTIDLSGLRFHSQPHEAITLVHLPPPHSPSELYVFKSLTRSQKYLYHELYTLLTMPLHPHLVPLPLYLVTRHCLFGGKIGVAGFILPYYSHGTLHSLLSSGCDIPCRAVLRWIRQLASVLLHIAAASPAGFYPDLKPDNILLIPPRNWSSASPPSLFDFDILLIDLELRGGFPSFTPPEVLHLENMLTISSRLTTCPKVHSKCVALLKSFFPPDNFLVPPPKEDTKYKFEGNERGFSLAWRSLGIRSRWEKAMVFMLGKVMWCLGEGRETLGCGIGVEMLREEQGDCWRRDADDERECNGLHNHDDGEQEPRIRKRRPGFPEFRVTPKELRPLIEACTAGAPEWEGRRRAVELRGGRIMPVHDSIVCSSTDGNFNGDDDNDAGYRMTAADTQKLAKEWWREEVRAAKRYCEDIVRRRSDGEEEEENDVLKKAASRPSLESVLKWIDELEAKGKVRNNGNA
ncbi:MAG: hypothetical protein Q9227_005245 [Pyrenula ochraceoflavens]